MLVAARVAQVAGEDRLRLSARVDGDAETDRDEIYQVGIGWRRWSRPSGREVPGRTGSGTVGKGHADDRVFPERHRRI